MQPIHWDGGFLARHGPLHLPLSKRIHIPPKGKRKSQVQKCLFWVDMLVFRRIEIWWSHSFFGYLDAIFGTFVVCISKRFLNSDPFGLGRCCNACDAINELYNCTSNFVVVTFCWGIACQTTTQLLCKEFVVGFERLHSTHTQKGIIPYHTMRLIYLPTFSWFFIPYYPWTLHSLDFVWYMRGNIYKWMSFPRAFADAIHPQIRSGHVVEKSSLAIQSYLLTRCLRYVLGVQMLTYDLCKGIWVYYLPLYG